MANKGTDQNFNAGNPQEAEPGKGASGQQWAVQTAQRTDVNDPEAEIPSNVDVEQNKAQIEAVAEQEEGKLPTTHGYVIDESGNLDNFAVEPPMQVVED
ncbi:hypothetical protein PN498_08525 [Oscillatoria sp. CS-180]|uniref:hypothetical protein n=1 Tax=Oscillatoria sp. CS-180 TaxID=3021720 RepID=UPI00232D6AA2|nr:hypothetical protein [Oscillatoria sp. CS-180]MDB9526028.1 hypothetical protein [Oscillatoria sp. CS-180]